MKIRTTKYIVKEGFLNAYRNKLMSLASISIVTATLVVFGIFFLILANLNYNLKILKQQPEMVVYCYPDLDEASLLKVENAIKTNDKIESYVRVSKQEAFEKVKKILGDRSNLLEGMDESFLPISFIIKLKKIQDSESVAEVFRKTVGVESVDYAQDVIQFVSKMTQWMRLISGVLIFVLLMVSMFIIANTIKLTVFARRREISIMKYIGATDWFIRWPFIVEGVIIGVIGAILAFMLIGYGYSAVESRFNSDLKQISLDFNNFINLIRIRDIGPRIIFVYMLIGTTVGILGSMISIRKHLHV